MKSFIEGVFSIKDNSSILDKLREYRIEYDETIVSKSFNRNNKTTIKLIIAMFLLWLLNQS